MARDSCDSEKVPSRKTEFHKTVIVGQIKNMPISAINGIDTVSKTRFCRSHPISFIQFPINNLMRTVQTLTKE
jgi:hypothetical protein